MKRQICGALLLASVAYNVAAEEEIPLNVQEWQETIEILTLAHEKILLGGWYQVKVVEGAECLATSLEKSWQELGKSLVIWDYTKLAIDTVINAPNLQSLSVKGDPLATPYWGRYYMYWNDADGRTVEDVLSAIDRAIEYAREQERNAIEVNASSDLLIEYDVQMMDKFNLSISKSINY